MARFTVSAALLLAAPLLSKGAKVTPVEKVIGLLERLDKKVEEEGKAEAAAYDKYACFCKEQADEKQYSIEKSTAKISKLSATVELLDAQIMGLSTEISQLGEQIGGTTNDMEAARASRDAEHKAFLVEQADAHGAIEACEGALEALSHSKKSMRGKVELEAAALAQVRAVASLSLRGRAAGAAELARLSSLLDDGKPGKANQYSYHSNDILATIETLRQKFIEEKNTLESEEFGSKSAFDKRQLNLANEKKFAAKDKAEREALAEQKTEAKAATEDEKGEESTDKAADQNFLATLTAQCEEKATLWDQRSRTRAAELAAISEATGALKDGAAPNYKANKKLVGVQKKAVVHHSQDGEIHLPAAPAFVQVQRHGARSAESEEQHEASRRVQELLATSGDQLGSPVLVAAALKVSVNEDHFVKVRQIIKDLVAKLQDDARSEKTQKAFCDEGIKKAATARDGAQSDVESLSAATESKASAKAQLQEDIAGLSKAVAENNRALMEATELRKREAAENQQTIVDSRAGQSSVESALRVLKEFYEGQALLQTEFVPANSDRQGKTVADRAPEVFDSEYQGSQESSKGVLGLLDVVLSDFSRTIETVTEEERAAQEAFDAFETTNKADTTSKSESIKTKDGQIADINDALLELSDNKANAQESHRNALDELGVLRSGCVAGEESYAERVEKREKEIEALKEAHGILENWQQ